jgi:hypothetical protein
MPYKKAASLKQELASMPGLDSPVLVGCPSCKMGISRILLPLGDKRPVLHSLEFLAEACAGSEWRRKFRKLLAGSAKNGGGGPRVVDISRLGSVVLSPGDTDGDDEDA